MRNITCLLAICVSMFSLSVKASDNNAAYIDQLLATGKKFSYNNKLDSAAYYLSKVEDHKEWASPDQLAIAAYRMLVVCTYAYDVKAGYQYVDKLKLILKQKNLLKDYTIGNIYIAISSFYDEIYEYQDALSYYHMLKEFLITADPTIAKKLASVLYTNWADTLMDLGKYEEALEKNHKAINIDMEIFGAASFDIAMGYINLGIIAQHIDLPKSEAYLTYAESILKKDFGYESPEYLTLQLARAETYIRKKEYALAVEICEKIIAALNVNDRAAFHPLGETYSKLGNIYFLKEEYPKAKSYFNKSIVSFKKVQGGDWAKVQQAWLDVAKCHLALKENYRAHAILDRLQAQTINEIKNIHLLKYSYLDLFLFEILKGKAKASLQLYQATSELPFLKEANTTYKLAIQKFKSFRQNLKGKDSRAVLFESNQKLFAEAVWVLYELWLSTKNEIYIEDLFSVTETQKNSVFSQSIRKQRAVENIDNGYSQMLEIEKINNLISQKEKLLLHLESFSQKTHQETISGILKEIEELSQLKENFISELKQKAPKFYNLIFAPTTPKIASIQNKLDNSRALITYYLSDAHLYITVINKDNINVSRKEIPKNFEQEIRKYQRSLNHSSASKSKEIAIQEFKNTAHLMYQYFIAPVETFLPSALSIIWDDKLYNTNFDAFLKTNAPTQLNYQSLDYLVKSYAFSYNYSAAFYMNEYRTKEKARKDWLAFAPEFQASATGNYISLRNMGALKYNQKEILRIKRQLHGTVYTSHKATLQHFLQEAEHYRLLHLATHGVANTVEGERSYLAFYESPYKHQSLQSQLQVKDIFKLNLKADMVVLSACETAIGEHTKGEGVMSLASSFLYAGASSIISTLWKINDESSCQLMEDFYKNLDLKLDKDVALSQAKRKFLSYARDSESHPFYWASFISVGETEALQTKNKISTIHYVANDFNFITNAFYFSLLLLIAMIATNIFGNSFWERWNFKSRRI